jgi:phosphopantothenoylcysteine decarboxylase/phosphopantothenate--cysteine ligase
MMGQTGDKSMLTNKRILLIIGGGIAAYKSLELIRRLKDEGASVRVVLTRAGAEFVTPLSVASLSGEKVMSELFDLTDETEIGHIQLSRQADLLVVAPATADLLAKMAHGHANDLATTALLATDKGVLVAPSMNVRMWQHAATQRNVAQLRADGVLFAGPDEGAMACGEFGPGRMAEVPAIMDAIKLALSGSAARPLSGKHVLVTAGPTREPIDPVRFISNHSSGKQGYAIAAAAAAAGARVTLVSGPVELPVPFGVMRVQVETATEMLKACEAALPADLAIFAAAVADWRVKNVGGEKLKKQAWSDGLKLDFTENPDILKTISVRTKLRPSLCVGFAAETANVIENAKAKLAAKSCDLIVANDVSATAGVFGGAQNTVSLVTAKGVEAWPRMDKADVARKLVARLAEMLS